MGEPMGLTPSFREKVWGKTRLMPWYPDSEKRIGEVWYLAPAGPAFEPLPILVKMLFTSDRLSVQVHPADGEEGPVGKTEMWHVVEAEPGASIAAGFHRAITRAELQQSSVSGEIVDLLNWEPVRPGDTLFNPAHTVHALGGGLVLFEIQQNSDVTYRLCDYGRGRETHLLKALAISDLGVRPGRVTPKPLGPGAGSWRDASIS